DDEDHDSDDEYSDEEPADSGVVPQSTEQLAKR
ncbi:hypothetical protein Tco_0647336, partial [Tanacetum coccineum]